VASGRRREVGKARIVARPLSPAGRPARAAEEPLPLPGGSRDYSKALRGAVPAWSHGNPGTCGGSRRRGPPPCRQRTAPRHHHPAGRRRRCSSVPTPAGRPPDRRTHTRTLARQKHVHLLSVHLSSRPPPRVARVTPGRRRGEWLAGPAGGFAPHKQQKARLQRTGQCRRDRAVDPPRTGRRASAHVPRPAPCAEALGDASRRREAGEEEGEELECARVAWGGRAGAGAAEHEPKASSRRLSRGAGARPTWKGRRTGRLKYVRRAASGRGAGGAGMFPRSAVRRRPEDSIRRGVRVS
jgi:hypothetical protein